MHCRICDEDYRSASAGGPGICPSCDCGVPPKQKKLARENQQLGMENLALSLRVELLEAKLKGREPKGFTPQMVAIAETGKWPSGDS